jgi:hypothetical protein
VDHEEGPERGGTQVGQEVRGPGGNPHQHPRRSQHTHQPGAQTDQPPPSVHASRPRHVCEREGDIDQGRGEEHQGQTLRAQVIEKKAQGSGFGAPLQQDQTRVGDGKDGHTNADGLPHPRQGPRDGFV